MIFSRSSNKTSDEEFVSKFSKFKIFCLIEQEHKASLKLCDDVSVHLYFTGTGKRIHVERSTVHKMFVYLLLLFYKWHNSCNRETTAYGLVLIESFKR